MAKQLLAFDPPPFRVVAKHLARDDDFLADAKPLLAIDNTKLDALVNALGEYESFLDQKTLSAKVLSVLGEGADSGHVARIIWRLSQLLRGADEPVETAVALLTEAIVEDSKRIPQKDRRRLGERISSLVGAPKGFSRQYKAEKLATATGAELEDIQIICDIRPVFNEDRTQIEGAVPLATLKASFLNLDGTTSSLEVRLTEWQIVDLCAKAESAKRKVSVIKRTLEDKSIVMPFTSATTDERATE